MSLTGNTEKVTENIFQELQEEKEIKELKDVDGLESYDLAFVGFPVHEFGQVKKVRDFLEKHSKATPILHDCSVHVFL